MVAPLLCSSLLGGLPVFTVVAFFAATVFKNAHIGQLESEPAAPPAFHFKWPTLQDGAPFLLFLALLTCDLILRVLHDRQVGMYDQKCVGHFPCRIYEERYARVATIPPSSPTFVTQLHGQHTSRE